MSSMMLGFGSRMLWLKKEQLVNKAGITKG